MNTIDLFTPREHEYHVGCEFATDIYREKLNMSISRFPDVMFIAHEHSRPIACIGLNDEIHNPIFSGDKDLWRALKEIPDSESVGEQYIWASCNDSLLAMLLISIFSSYASKSSIRNVIFTGTQNSLNALQKIGASVIKLHRVKKEILFPSDQKNCERWFSLYRRALVCVLQTNQMEKLNEIMLDTYRNDIELGPKLKKIFYHQSVELI